MYVINSSNNMPSAKQGSNWCHFYVIFGMTRYKEVLYAVYFSKIAINGLWGLGLQNHNAVI